MYADKVLLRRCPVRAGSGAGHCQVGEAIPFDLSQLGDGGELARVQHATPGNATASASTTGDYPFQRGCAALSANCISFRPPRFTTRNGMWSVNSLGDRHAAVSSGFSDPAGQHLAQEGAQPIVSDSRTFNPSVRMSTRSQQCHDACLLGGEQFVPRGSSCCRAVRASGLGDVVGMDAYSYPGSPPRSPAGGTRRGAGL